MNHYAVKVINSGRFFFHCDCRECLIMRKIEKGAVNKKIRALGKKESRKLFLQDYTL